MNINEMTFGIELECTIPQTAIDANGVSVGGYHAGRQIAAFPQGWNAQMDSSIIPAPGFRAVEVVSPILKGLDGLRQIKTVVTMLKAWGTKVNSSCGFHVHVGFQNQNITSLRRLTHLVSNLEKALYASTGTHSREQGHYCKSIKAGFRDQRYTAQFSSMGNAFRDRFHILNLKPLVEGQRPAVEFRAFAGTMNLTKIIASVRMCLAFVQKACKSTRAMTWDAPTVAEGSPRFRSGVGQTELTRFFYAMGWTLGCTANDEVFGNLVDEAGELTTMEQSKRILMKMARKYDGVAIDGIED